MTPSLRDGDEVEVDVLIRKPRVGDVVLYLDSERATILHRVIAQGGDWFRTRGDAARVPDERIALERLVGIARVPPRPWHARLRGLEARVREVARLPRKVAGHLRARRNRQHFQ